MNPTPEHIAAAEKRLSGWNTGAAPRVVNEWLSVRLSKLEDERYAHLQHSMSVLFAPDRTVPADPECRLCREIAEEARVAGLWQNRARRWLSARMPRVHIGECD